MRWQRDIEQVIELAQAELPAAVSDRPVDEDWVACVFMLSQDAGDEVMPTLCGAARILAKDEDGIVVSRVDTF